ncbi:transcriptional regulator, GntR family [Thalassovita litoralis]|jgi:GntR family transcriptional regulator of vanillate catabolism|uniref:Transcriptional regulator, GntR family n=1 Tax=Thalassovita litoralis TaxID=1010611 RepID=A0A521F4F1_9RHOB|nr:GntR family transcriptional regulator [Thalassovita litoralis]SMO90400.1 transcriptional regulator, GntR family [Thalassovita litoralis]
MSATSTEEVTNILREHIMCGQIHPGERLQQERLARALGVSRTPLRTALANLANEGLLQYEANRGYTVRAFDRKDIIDGYAARAVLEGLAASSVATAGIDFSTLEKMERWLDIGDTALAKGKLDPKDIDAYRRMNVCFHDEIIARADNRWISELVRQTQLIPFASNRMIVWQDFDIMYRTHDDHHRILEALKRRDPIRADYLMREHVNFAGEYLAQCIETGRIITAPDVSASTTELVQ